MRTQLRRPCLRDPRAKKNAPQPRTLTTRPPAVHTFAQRSLPEKRKGSHVSSLPLRIRPRCSSTGQRVKVTARHASQSSRGHPANRYARIAAGNSPFLSSAINAPTDFIHYRCRRRGPLAKRIVCFSSPCHTGR